MQEALGVQSGEKSACTVSYTMSARKAQMHSEMAGRHSTRRVGELIAGCLKGAWRTAPPAFELTPDELESISPFLLGSGAGPLAWWRLRNSPLKANLTAIALHEEYREQCLYAALRESEVSRLSSLLENAGIESLLVKGWAVARLYPEAGLRPSGDIDLIVSPTAYERARELTKGFASPWFGIDLHAGGNEPTHAVRADGATFDDLLERSSRVTVSDASVRVLGPEDSLRVLCFHFWHHGAWRPLWLCDIAVALESRPVDFDWDLTLGKNPAADWVACALGAAHQLLQARIEDTPVAARAKKLPSWLIPTILKQWATPYPEQHAPPESVRYVWRRPARIGRAVRSRWVDPIRATIEFDAAFNSFPRLPYQVGNYFRTGARFAARRAKG